MTSELKCPFCQTELEQVIELWRGGHILGCPKCKRNTDDIFWQALIQAKQDLEIATKALEKLICEYNRCRDEEFEGEDIDWEWWAMAAKNVVEAALEQIEHKEK